MHYWERQRECAPLQCFRKRGSAQHWPLTSSRSTVLSAKENNWKYPMITIKSIKLLSVQTAQCSHSNSLKNTQMSVLEPAPAPLPQTTSVVLLLCFSPSAHSVHLPDICAQKTFNIMGLKLMRFGFFVFPRWVHFTVLVSHICTMKHHRVQQNQGHSGLLKALNNKLLKLYMLEENSCIYILSS